MQKAIESYFAIRVKLPESKGLFALTRPSLQPPVPGDKFPLLQAKPVLTRPSLQSCRAFSSFDVSEEGGFARLIVYARFGRCANNGGVECAIACRILAGSPDSQGLMSIFAFATNSSEHAGKAYQRSIAGSSHAHWVQRGAGNGRNESFGSWFSSRGKTITRRIIREENGEE